MAAVASRPRSATYMVQINIYCFERRKSDDTLVYIFLKITDKYNTIHFQGLKYHFDYYKVIHDDEVTILCFIFILRTKLLLSN